VPDPARDLGDSVLSRSRHRAAATELHLCHPASLQPSSCRSLEAASCRRRLGAVNRHGAQTAHSCSGERHASAAVFPATRGSIDARGLAGPGVAHFAALARCARACSAAHRCCGCSLHGLAAEPRRPGSVDFGASSVEGVYDLLNTRQVLLLHSAGALRSSAHASRNPPSGYRVATARTHKRRRRALSTLPRCK
jgi:hypothetical protein